jgi:hypothetical protein
MQKLPRNVVFHRALCWDTCCSYYITAGVRFSARAEFLCIPQRPDRLWGPPKLLDEAVMFETFKDGRLLEYAKKTSGLRKP